MPGACRPVDRAVDDTSRRAEITELVESTIGCRRGRGAGHAGKGSESAGSTGEVEEPAPRDVVEGSGGSGMRLLEGQMARTSQHGKRS